MPQPMFKRVLLRLSGEARAASQGFGVESPRIHEIAAGRADVHSVGVQIAFVVGGGNGSPYFSTDTAASLRAMEIKADAILKATKVDGIYDADPMIVKDAQKFSQITYMEVLRQGLKVMDSTAISLCKDNNLPIIVFNLNQRGNIRRVVLGEKIGSLVSA